MQMEIGGDLELAWNHFLWKRHYRCENFLPEGRSAIMMSNGRVSVRLILRHILKVKRGEEVLLPAYVFEGLLTPFRESEMEITFYRLNPDLSLDLNDIQKKINPNTRILYLLHYFGFPQPINGLEKLRQQYPSCAIIEDITQSYLTDRLDQTMGKLGDFAYFVYMKYVPVPDGSLLRFNRSMPDIDWNNRQFKHFLYYSSRYLAMNLKNLYLHTRLIPKTWHQRLFGYAARILETYPMYARMSWISSRLVDTFNYDQIIEIRRNNYEYLSKRWNFDQIIPLFSSLPSTVCPMGFVVLTEQRDLIRNELSKSGIYCPVHWQAINRGDGNLLSRSIDRAEFPVSWDIASRIMMIPIDQRYRQKEMDYILFNLQRICKQLRYSLVKDARTIQVGH